MQLIACSWIRAAASALVVCALVCAQTLAADSAGKLTMPAPGVHEETAVYEQEQPSRWGNRKRTQRAPVNTENPPLLADTPVPAPIEVSEPYTMTPEERANAVPEIRAEDVIRPQPEPASRPAMPAAAQTPVRQAMPPAETVAAPVAVAEPLPPPVDESVAMDAMTAMPPPPSFEPLYNPGTYVIADMPQETILMPAEEETTYQADANHPAMSQPSPEAVEKYRVRLEDRLLERYGNLPEYAGKVARVRVVLSRPLDVSLDGSLIRAEFDQLVYDNWGNRMPDLEKEYYIVTFGSGGVRQVRSDPSIRIGRDLE